MNAGAEIKLSALFSDGMVLQRNKPVAIWGQADPNVKIMVRFGGIVRRTNTDENGNFGTVKSYVRFINSPHPFDSSGFKNVLRIKNVLVGEVWLCSGQSNMEWTVEQSANFEEEQARANYPQIRMITVKKKFSTRTSINL